MRRLVIIFLILLLAGCTTMRQEIRQPDGTVKITEYTGGFREAKNVDVKIGEDRIKLKEATVDNAVLQALIQALIAAGAAQ